MKNPPMAASVPGGGAENTLHLGGAVERIRLRDHARERHREPGGRQREEKAVDVVRHHKVGEALVASSFMLPSGSL